MCSCDVDPTVFGWGHVAGPWYLNFGEEYADSRTRTSSALALLLSTKQQSGSQLERSAANSSQSVSGPVGASAGASRLRCAARSRAARSSAARPRVCSCVCSRAMYRSPPLRPRPLMHTKRKEKRSGESEAGLPSERPAAWLAADPAIAELGCPRGRRDAVLNRTHVSPRVRVAHESRSSSLKT